MHDHSKKLGIYNFPEKRPNTLDMKLLNWNNMLKWLVIYILNKVALYLYEGELCSKVIERIFNMATNENSGHWFDCHKQKM